MAFDGWVCGVIDGGSVGGEKIARLGLATRLILTWVVNELLINAALM